MAYRSISMAYRFINLFQRLVRKDLHILLYVWIQQVMVTEWISNASLYNKYRLHYSLLTLKMTAAKITILQQSTVTVRDCVEVFSFI